MQAGLSNASWSGRPRTHDEDRVASLLRTVFASKPKAGTYWGVRRVAEKTSISKTTATSWSAASKRSSALQRLRLPVRLDRHRRLDPCEA